MRPDADDVPDGESNPTRGPHLARKANRLRPQSEKRGQLLPLRSAEAGWSARRWMGCERLHAPLASLLEPLADNSFADPYGFSDRTL